MDRSGSQAHRTYSSSTSSGETCDRLTRIEEEPWRVVSVHAPDTTSSADCSTRRSSGEKEQRAARTTRKSATFHDMRELRKNTELSAQLATAPERTLSRQSHQNASRKKSLLLEMGERIRLFSTGSFVSTVPHPSRRPSSPCRSPSPPPRRPPPVPKTQSLNSFHEPCVVVVHPGCEGHSQAPRRCGGRGGRVGPQSGGGHIGSVISLHNQQELSAVEGELWKTPSQLGVLCQHCASDDIPCPKACQQNLRTPSVPSLYSLAQSDYSTNEPLCRICHCCWPTDDADPLISPCRCSGSLQYVHVSCLMHWLDISSRKLHRPAVCELCLYKYRRRRVLKYREIKLPECPASDLRYYSLFIVSIILMLLSALATVVCFQLEKKYGIAQPNNKIPSPSTPAPAPPADPTDRDQLENLLSTVTLAAACVFFIAFFMAMYAHVKSGLSFCNYLTLCWTSNLEWSIEEYKQHRDTQYLSKLEELRRKINEKSKKAPEEIEPLRSSVIVID